MHRTIETLMNEHRVIEQVLAVLEAAAVLDEAGTPVARSRVSELGEFFKGFADTCHHGKEEDVLFRIMTEVGFPRDRGPIAVMLAEHELGREHVRALRAIGAGKGPLTAAERSSFASHAKAFAPLLRQHIAKEDSVLYPMALQAIPAATLDAMAEQFEQFEATITGAGEHERLHALADTLVAAFPEVAPCVPSPACHGCHGHP